MGEEDKKKASSLRGRVARSRKTYNRKSSPMPLIIGVVVLAVMGVGLFVFLGGPEEKRDGTRNDSETTQGETSTAAAQPARAAPKNLFELIYWARKDSLKNPDKALADLSAQESKYGDVPDFQMAKALAVGKKIDRAKGNAENKRFAEEKLRCLEKVQELLDAGKAWDDDPMKSRTGNLVQSLEQCRLLVKKYSK